MTEIEKKAEEMRNEIKSAKEKAEASEKKAIEAQQKAEAAEKKLADAEKTIQEQKSSIDNLDKSVQDQQKAIEELKKRIKAEQIRSFASALYDAMTERKSEMEKFVKGEGSMLMSKMSFKFTTGNITGSSMGVQLDRNIYSDRILPFAFYSTFPKVERTGNSLEWNEGSYTSNAGYVGEFTAQSTADTAAVGAKTRQYGKLAALLEISQEVSDWFNDIYVWARGKGIREILKKADSEIWKGDGNDSSQKNHVYGIKTQGCTAYAATGAKYESATVADVILDAIAQAKANGFMADVVIVPYTIEAQLRGLKDKNGNYLYNQVTGMLGQVQVVSTTEMAANELLVAERACVEIDEKGEYELELERVAGKDGWNVWLRKPMQVKVPTSEKKGVIYVSDIAAAITGLAPAVKA